MKNYITFVNDHSGSMAHLARAAAKDYNSMIDAVKNAASREMLDTVVSVVGVGFGPRGTSTKRQVVISNPHVLKPISNWSTEGGTPLFDGIHDAIDLMESLPDYNSPDVSFLLSVTTDGQEEHSTKNNRTVLANRIHQLQASGRWTLVFRVPQGGRRHLQGLNIPYENIQEWETSEAGMKVATAATTRAMDTYYSARAQGATSSTVFYANAQSVNTAALVDITKDVSLYVVPDNLNGIEIRDFILKHRMEYLKGAAFYQLTKTEARVQPSKLIAVRDRTTGKIYSGNEARNMLGLSTVNNIRLHPGDHGNFDIFIQSESVNRKLVGGTGVIYYPKIGKPFASDDPALQYGKPKTDITGVVQLPAVPVSNKPTPSPIPKAPRPSTWEYNGKPVKFFKTRDGARDEARLVRKSVYDAKAVGFNGAPERWFIVV